MERLLTSSAALLVGTGLLACSTPQLLAHEPHTDAASDDVRAADAGTHDASPPPDTQVDGAPGLDGAREVSLDGSAAHDAATDAGLESDASRDASNGRHDASDGSDGPTPPTCQEGTCCIDGAEFLPGALNPANSCQVCDPTQSVHAFSPAEPGSCGEGCECSAGTPREVLCSDIHDNDADDRLNCSDLDCAGKLCRVSENVRVYPAKDVRITIDSRFASGQTLEGEQSMLVQVGSLASSHVRMEFDNIRAHVGLKIEEAVLTVFVETDDSSLALHGPDGNWIESKKGGVGYRTWDVTALVKSWAEAEGPRFVTLQPAVFGKAVYVRGSEFFENMSDPHIFVTYEGECAAGLCPSL